MDNYETTQETQVALNPVPEVYQSEDRIDDIYLPKELPTRTEAQGHNSPET
jgi:hypothetical protein